MTKKKETVTNLDADTTAEVDESVIEEVAIESTIKEPVVAEPELRKPPNWEPPHVHIPVSNKFLYVDIAPEASGWCITIGFANEADARRFIELVTPHIESIDK